MEIKNTKSIDGKAGLRVFLYGLNRSGKTTHASTWPRPIYLVPSSAKNEMISVPDDITVIFFKGVEDFRDTCKFVGDAISKNKPIGEYVPKTVIIDNITSMQMSWEEEIKFRRKINKLEWSDWDTLKSALAYAMMTLNDLPVHLIWIAHSYIKTYKVDNKEYQKGEWTIKGAASQFIPNHSDLLLYLEQVDKGPRGSMWRIHGRKKDIWTAGVRMPVAHQKAPFAVLESNDKEFGMHPSYDDMAARLSLPTVEEDWEQYVTNLETKGKRK